MVTVSNVINHLDKFRVSIQPIKFVQSLGMVVPVSEGKEPNTWPYPPIPKSSSIQISWGFMLNLGVWSSLLSNLSNAAQSRSICAKQAAWRSFSHFQGWIKPWYLNQKPLSANIFSVGQLGLPFWLRHSPHLSTIRCLLSHCCWGVPFREWHP